MDHHGLPLPIRREGVARLDVLGGQVREVVSICASVMPAAR
jgi:hypothetical protein